MNGGPKREGLHLSYRISELHRIEQLFDSGAHCSMWFLRSFAFSPWSGLLLRSPSDLTVYPRSRCPLYLTMLSRFSYPSVNLFCHLREFFTVWTAKRYSVLFVFEQEKRVNYTNYTEEIIQKPNSIKIGSLIFNELVCKGTNRVERILFYFPKTNNKFIKCI